MSNYSSYSGHERDSIPFSCPLLFPLKGTQRKWSRAALSVPVRVKNILFLATFEKIELFFSDFLTLFNLFYEKNYLFFYFLFKDFPKHLMLIKNSNTGNSRYPLTLRIVLFFGDEINFIHLS